MWRIQDKLKQDIRYQLSERSLLIRRQCPRPNVLHLVLLPSLEIIPTIQTTLSTTMKFSAFLNNAVNSINNIIEEQQANLNRGRDAEFQIPPIQRSFEYDEVHPSKHFLRWPIVYNDNSIDDEVSGPGYEWEEEGSCDSIYLYDAQPITCHHGDHQPETMLREPKATFPFAEAVMLLPGEGMVTETPDKEFDPSCMPSVKDFVAPPTPSIPTIVIVDATLDLSGSPFVLPLFGYDLFQTHVPVSEPKLSVSASETEDETEQECSDETQPVIVKKDIYTPLPTRKSRPRRAHLIEVPAPVVEKKSRVDIAKSVNTSLVASQALWETCDSIIDDVSAYIVEEIAEEPVVIPASNSVLNESLMRGNDLDFVESPSFTFMNDKEGEEIFGTEIGEIFPIPLAEEGPNVLLRSFEVINVEDAEQSFEFVDAASCVNILSDQSFEIVDHINALPSCTSLIAEEEDAFDDLHDIKLEGIPEMSWEGQKIRSALQKSSKLNFKASSMIPRMTPRKAAASSSKIPMAPKRTALKKAHGWKM